MKFAAVTCHVMLSLPKHLRPFGYAQGDRMGQSGWGDRMGQSKDRAPEVQAEGRPRP